MAIELELKAVVEDPEALRRALEAAGAVNSYRGMLRDRRYDREGELERQDIILRLRHWIPRAGAEHAELGWKGPSRVDGHGYKHSREIECPVGDGPNPGLLLEALGYRLSHAIDRYVEIFRLGDAVARLEWYPRMDVLVEIEGDSAGIERLIAATGLPREGCVPDGLARFAARFERRTGQPAILAESALGVEPPTWDFR